MRSFKTFELENNIVAIWPLSKDTVSRYIHWAAFKKYLSTSTIIAYMSHIKLVHKLKNLDYEACKDFAFKSHIRGLKNLNFYAPPKVNRKKTMTLPLLKILGHALAGSDWLGSTKLVTWTIFSVSFFGSFRVGELLPKKEHTFNPFETLLWSDIQFFDDFSVQIHNKVPKNRTEGGEFISLFPFPGHNCCPVEALHSMKNLSKTSDSPVFIFENGKFPTCSLMNKIIVKLLSKHIGEQANLYSCKSFRSALPSALAALPVSGNEKFIKRWGRWNSEAFEKYVRLNHLAKKKIFVKFAEALIL